MEMPVLRAIESDFDNKSWQRLIAAAFPLALSWEGKKAEYENVDKVKKVEKAEKVPQKTSESCIRWVSADSFPVKPFGFVLHLVLFVHFFTHPFLHTLNINSTKFKVIFINCVS